MSGRLTARRVDIIITVSFTFAIRKELKLGMYSPNSLNPPLPEQFCFQRNRTEEQIIKLFDAYNGSREKNARRKTFFFLILEFYFLRVQSF